MYNGYVNIRRRGTSARTYARKQARGATRQSSRMSQTPEFPHVADTTIHGLRGHALHTDHRPQ